MVTVGEFPDDVRRFILDIINSVEQLETLLLLRGQPDREWSAQAVSQALYTQPEAAAMRLTDLHARGLLTVTEGPERLYRYRPATGDQDRLIGQLADVYRERRVAVISLIYSKPLNQVQAFADAFKFRKGE